MEIQYDKPLRERIMLGMTVGNCQLYFFRIVDWYFRAVNRQAIQIVASQESVLEIVNRGNFLAVASHAEGVFAIDCDSCKFKPAKGAAYRSNEIFYWIRFQVSYKALWRAES